MKKSDVFTPIEIATKMCSYLHPTGTLLEPSVGAGNLLTPLDWSNYQIDVYDIEQSYLDEIVSHPNLVKNLCSFITTPIDKMYDNIILNPPFIRIQDIPIDERRVINFSGNFDIYLVFLKKCIQVLSDTGIMVAITPSSFLYNKSSKEFRAFLIKNRLVCRIVDYMDKKVFPSVSVYCCITVFTKSPKTHLIYQDENISYENLTDSFFNINPSTDILGNFVSIRNGIATLRDKIFIHSEKLFEEPCWNRILKVSKNELKWIIYPYDCNDKIIPEVEFSSNNPLTWNYLKNYETELSKRDKGLKKYETWYAYGRRQGLGFSMAPTIYISTMGGIDFPIITKKVPLLFYSGLSIIPNGDIDIDGIKQVITNNREWIFKNSSKRSGGWININSNVIKNIQLRQSK
jgi:hypothetical protein